MEHGTFVKMLSRVSYMDIVCYKLISIHNLAYIAFQVFTKIICLIGGKL